MKQPVNAREGEMRNQTLGRNKAKDSDEFLIQAPLIDATCGLPFEWTTESVPKEAVYQKRRGVKGVLG